MKKYILKYIVSFLLAILIVGFAIIAYLITKNLIAAIGTATFFYTISKPIQEDLEKLTQPKMKLRVVAIYEDKEALFAEKINEKIDELIKEGKSIEVINVLSTKRAVIQYKEKK
ncbi:hypothetical protein F7731_09370 [Cytobacillus depressus]|uniref:Uncharacterized protein n=1 Tax=Cytobacillus depressus TaxID=1602942 RepID=A0A6L3V789_9BACI|nr:hypothetical protein [Cytobacillus depressus]KAB2336570.1 hypothetical protein F7731_09370 [Cytobacillus depressus]